MDITEKQLQILENLSEFKFLTSNQLMRLMGYKENSHINSMLKRMRERRRPLIKRKEFGFYPGAGRLAPVHFLTRYGADFLVDYLGFDANKIKVPKEHYPLFVRDYFHRKSTIDFNISLKLFCNEHNFEKKFFNYYFEQVGSQRNRTARFINSLKIREDLTIIPDGIGKIATNEDNLFLFEQHNGSDTKRAVNQIINHISAIEIGVVSEIFNYPRGVRVIYVFEKESCKISVIKELYKIDRIRNFIPYFLFKSQGELNDKFNERWTLFNGLKTNLFKMNK
ncbi:hypothetical protein AB4189_09690 [Vibrio sp. 10N.286.49.E1]|uniref:hypothetical protein n=1 Tax=unclassified Vibrio TaxID=2614977 RepID=UPI00354D04E1